MSRSTPSTSSSMLISVLALALALGTTACPGDSPPPGGTTETSTQASRSAAQSQATAAVARIDVGVAMFDELRAQTDAVVLDVRTAQEFSEGHVPDALNIDIMAAGFAAAASKLDKNSPVLVYCRSGRRSLKAASTLSTLGFPSVHNLEGGYVAWAAAKSGD